jgi:2-phosphoglycolate phosphatase
MNNHKFNVDAVLFDLDGTILDSIGIYFQIIETVFDRLELAMPSKEKIREAAKTGEFEWDLVFPAENQEKMDNLIKQTHQITAQIYPKLFGANLKLVPSAKETLEIILQKGIKVGVVTSTPRQNMTLKMPALEGLGIKDLLEVIVAADDAPRKKPAPDPLLMGSRKLDISPAQCMYVGDSRTDIQAGKAAGMLTAGVLTGIDDREALKRENPDALIDSIANLQDMLV